jgi:xanthine dehydrogenase iron-sulfur cluster and FAD-binding subunit A
MSMYSTLQSNPKATEEELLESINANLCRCTGYRPIVSALKEISSKTASGASVAPKHDFPNELRTRQPEYFTISGQRVKW